jgi:putative nucleotidyltransferase with HDIG domain
VPSIELLSDARVDAGQTLLERRMSVRAEVPPDLVREWVAEAWARYERATVRAYVPILAERSVLDRIRGLPAGDDHWSAGRLPLRTWAWRTAERLLADELPRRWAHSCGVARQAARIAAAFPAEEQEILVASAWLHDIGYASAVRSSGMHQLDGARYLARRGVPWRLCALVAHHAGAAAVADLVDLGDALAVFGDEGGPTRDALWYCDMTTSPDGGLVSFDDRMAELRRRRRPEDPVIRALDVNGAERAAAVRRTEARLG